jgi:REP element-mobilizing transposase RayT
MMSQSQGESPGLKHHKGWHSRGYLPHFDRPGLIQAITFRLADALPAHVVAALAEELDEETSAEKRALVEAHLNAGYGACYLRDPAIGQLVENAFLYFDGVRYRLIAWVVMPNHVHVLIEIIEGYPLDRIIHSWKSYTANEANKILNREGRFWYPDYYDRFIRDERHFYNAVRYIHENPVKAGLVENPEDWPFSSARYWQTVQVGELGGIGETGQDARDPFPGSPSGSPSASPPGSLPGSQSS